MAERCTDLTKVLRLPGFWHWKGGASYRELPAEECVPQDAHTHESFDAERLNRLVK